MTNFRNIPFSPPHITDAEIAEVIDTLKSGWITTGPKTKAFERMLTEYCGVARVICLNSATAGLELILRLLEIGVGDEVITTSYTYAATANIILHTGARPVFVDVGEDFNICPRAIDAAITCKTKAIIAVDFAGLPARYDEIYDVLGSNKNRYIPRNNTLQTALDRPFLIADAAHSIGARFGQRMAAALADFSVFSFHAVKNLTTAEGGAIVFNDIGCTSSAEIYKKLQLLSLHGQSKDALAKMQAGSWFYTIELPGYKYNMTDIAASLGIAQLKRYEAEILPARKKIILAYESEFENDARFITPIINDGIRETSYHLYALRLNHKTEDERAKIITSMAERGISLNVHFIPVVMHPAYREMGYRMADYPKTFAKYENEISLPVYPQLSMIDLKFICDELKKAV